MTTRKIEKYSTEGPQKIHVWFRESEVRGSGLIQIDVEGAIRIIDNHARFVLDVQEFKNLLKAGLRFDERISN